MEPVPTPEAPTPAPVIAPTPTISPVPPPTPISTPVPTPTPAVAPAARAFPAPSAARKLPDAAENEIVPFIDFPNSDIRDVLGLYETLTGKKALYDSTVQGNIRVRVSKPLPRSEAIRILETVFSLNNFTLIPGPGDIVRVINTSKNARQFPIQIYSELDQLPERNQVVSFLFKLENADPQEVKTTLDQVISPTPSVTNIVPLAKSQAVLVTEYSDVVRNLALIVARLDGKPAEVVSQFFQLERADAKEVVERLTKMFEKPNQGATAGAGSGVTPPAAPRPPGTPATPGVIGPVTLSEDSLITGKIRIEADLRTNRIHVITRPVNLPFLRTLIEELDSGTPLGVPCTRPLRFVLAGDVLDVVAGAVAEPGVKVEKLEGGGRGTGAATPVSNTSGNLGNSSTSTSARSSSRGSSVSAGSFGSGNAAPQTDTAPEGRIIRNTKILADNRINAIIVVGSDEMKTKVFKLLDQIDVRAPQVMLTVVIGQLTLNDTEQFGVDYLLSKGNLGSLLGLSGSTLFTGTGALPISVPTGTSLKNVFSVSSLPTTGGGVSGLIGAGNSLDILVSALESTSRFRVTSRPVIFTSNNRAAVISSGQSLPVASQINTGYVTNGVTTNVDYIDVQLKLSVLPLINSEGEVTLHITQENNDVGSFNSSLNAYNVSTQSIDTTVSVANQATLVLGGLVKESKNITKSGIPILYKLPLIGPLFGNKNKTVDRTELVVLIRPTVTRGPVEDVRTGERVIEKTNFPSDLDATLDPKGTRIKAEAKEQSFAVPKPFLRDEK